MLIELLIALLIGIILGTITGLLPGIHINLVGAILISSSAFFLDITSPIILVIFIVSLSITHIFVDFIPSIFLGAPDEETALSVLPGHELLKNGRGYEAIFLSVLGCIIAIPMLIILTIVFISILKQIENTIKFLIPFLLILSSVFILIKEKNKTSGVIVFILAGFLGIFTLNSSIKESLLPMLSGLFGVSSLLISIKSKTKIPNQIYEIEKIKKYELIKPIFASLIASPLCSFLPGLGSGQAATIGASITKLTNKGFLILIGITNLLVMGLSFSVLYVIEKTRTGSAVFVKEILEKLTINHLSIILTAIILTSIIAFFLTLKLSKIFCRLISKINYQKISIIVIILILLFVFIFSGINGILVLAVSTFIGIYCILSGNKRILLMGCLIIPTVLIYLF